MGQDNVASVSKLPAKDSNGEPNPYHMVKNDRGDNVRRMNPTFFLAKAPAIMTVKLGDHVIQLERKDFSTGSVGYYGTGKLSLELAGAEAEFQLGFNMTLIGSKTDERVKAAEARKAKT